MSTWTDGYVAELNYTYGHYRELTPALLAFAAMAKGVRPPDMNGPLTYCELGCGHGVSANILAASNPNIEIYANDFNPAQIAWANALAKEGQVSNVHFSDASFDEYLVDDSLPQFDMIALHGIYSWVSAENRKAIVDFIRKKLNVGGLVYVSYNVLPGWATGMPLRRLFVDHATTTGGPLSSRIEKALMFADRLSSANIAYFRDVPAAGKRLQNIHTQNRNYIAHEFFNKDWTPFYFADVAAELDDAKLGYVGSVHLLDHVEGFNFTGEHFLLLNEMANPRVRETLRDYFTLQQFRRDLFSRGSIQMAIGPLQEAWLDTRFALTMPREKFQLKVLGPLGEMTLQEEVYAPILDALATGPKTARAMLQSEPKISALGWGRLQEALKVLVGGSNVQPCLDAKGDAKRAQSTKLFNAAVLKRATWGNDLHYLASPVTGGGVGLDRFEQMFLVARAEKHQDPPQRVWEQLQQLGQNLLKDGKPIEAPEENLAELRRRYENFQAALPLWQQLGLV